MILLVHLLFGALIGQKISNPILAVILAYFSHYFLDIFPHIEYPTDNITKNKWKKAAPDLLRVGLDFLIGILIIFLLFKGNIIIYICAFAAIVPDGFSVLNSLLPNKILDKHDFFHKNKIHFLKNKKISNTWRILSQIAAVVISIILIRL